MCALCTDVIDSINSDKVPLSQEQARFMQLVANSVRLRPDQHYEIALPLRYQDISLPNNKVQVEQRADNFKRHFLKKPQFFEDYISGASPASRARGAKLKTGGKAENQR